jgi:Tfp pilus assembly protein PilO
MASSAESALADFSRKPTGYKVAVFAGVGALLGLLYWQFLLSPLRKERTELEENRDQMEEDSRRLDREMVEYRKLSERSAQLRQMIEQNQKALPTGAELPAFFETLNRKVGEAGVEVKKWEYKKEEPVETFIKVPLEIEITGSFYQIERFFASLVPREEPATSAEGTTPDRERIITIEDLTLSVSQQRSRDLLLSAQFTASTFRQESTTQDLGLPAPTAPAGAPGAPLPPQATPQGAKVRVDGSMNKSETRVQGAGEGQANGAKSP